MIFQPSQSVELAPILARPAAAVPVAVGLIRVDDDAGPLTLNVRLEFIERAQSGPSAFVPIGRTLPAVTLRIREGRDRVVHEWTYPAQAWVTRDLIVQCSARGLDVAALVPQLGAPIASLEPARLVAWVTRGVLTQTDLQGRIHLYNSDAAFQAGVISGDDCTIPPGCSALRVRVPAQGGLGGALANFPPTLRLVQADARGVPIYTYTINATTEQTIPLQPTSRFVYCTKVVPTILPMVPITWVRHA